MKRGVSPRAVAPGKVASHLTRPLSAAGGTRHKSSKYRSIPTEIDGIKFPSRLEARRYSELKLLQAAGEISSLEMQVAFILHARGGQPVGKYVADFVYRNAGGCQIVEDTKGFLTALYKWKRKHLFAEYGITIIETSRGDLKRPTLNIKTVRAETSL